MLEEEALDDRAERADDQWCQEQCVPVIDAELVEHDPGGKRAQHVERSVREIDNAQQAKDDGQPQAEQGVKRAVDQAQQQLGQKSLKGNRSEEHTSELQSRQYL